MNALLAGFALGLGSSAHCVVMCGPLVVTLGRPSGAPSRRAQLRHVLLYQAGRVTTYVALAVPAGLLGETLAFRGLASALAIGAGVVLLAAAIGSARPGRTSPAGAAWARLIARASVAIAHWASRHDIAGPISTGALNGVLPCGLVYAGLAAAGASGSMAGAMLVMAGFGVGTAGPLMAMSLGAVSLPAAVRLRLRPLGPIVLALAAAILIARGAAMPHPHPAGAVAPMAQAHHH